MLRHAWPVNSEKFGQRFKFCLAYLGHFGKIWELRNEITKSEERFEDLTDFQNVQTYWLWRFRSRVQGRIVDLYLTGEGPRQPHEQFVLLMAECALFVIIKRTRTAHILPLMKEGEEILLNF